MTISETMDNNIVPQENTHNPKRDDNGGLIEPNGTRPSDLPCGLFALFDGVVIKDLVSRPELNSQSGVVKHLQGDRLVVELDDFGGSPVAVKPSNLELVETATPIDISARLRDAQSLSREFSETFAVPSAEALAVFPRPSLDMVKVCDGGERFWVAVRSVVDDVITGIVDNDLVGGQAYASYGTLVRFERRHIYRLVVFLEPVREEYKVKRYLGAHAGAREYFLDQIDGPIDEQQLGVPVESVAAVEAWVASTPGALDGTGLTVDDFAVHHLHHLEKFSGNTTYYDNLMNLCVASRIEAFALDD